MKQQVKAEEFEKFAYRKGFANGFNASQLLVWYHLEKLIPKLDEESKKLIRGFLKTIKQ